MSRYLVNNKMANRTSLRTMSNHGSEWLWCEDKVPNSIPRLHSLLLRFILVYLLNTVRYQAPLYERRVFSLLCLGTLGAVYTCQISCPKISQCPWE